MNLTQLINDNVNTPDTLLSYYNRPEMLVMLAEHVDSVKSGRTGVCKLTHERNIYMLLPYSIGNGQYIFIERIWANDSMFLVGSIIRAYHPKDLFLNHSALDIEVSFNIPVTNTRCLDIRFHERETITFIYPSSSIGRFRYRFHELSGYAIDIAMHNAMSMFDFMIGQDVDIHPDRYVEVLDELYDELHSDYVKEIKDYYYRHQSKIENGLDYTDVLLKGL